jgi:hypothetical protein
VYSRAQQRQVVGLLRTAWSLSNPRNVSISHRRSVRLLDEFVGAKN